MSIDQLLQDHLVINGDLAEITIDPTKPADYALFLAAKRLPSYRVQGNRIVTHTTNLRFIGHRHAADQANDFDPAPYLWDYQGWMVSAALRKRKFAIFADCGLGKTPCIYEWVRHVLRRVTGKVIIVSPLMIIPQTIEEAARWYGGVLPITNVHEAGLQDWLESDSRVGIVNNERFYSEVTLPGVGAVVIDESSSLKGEDSRFRINVTDACRGMEYKLCCTATPAPNDRIEYANHALFLDQVRRADEFYAKFFVNRDNEWQLKAHATEPFYRHLASWSVFVRSPAAYGFADNLAGLQTPTIEEIRIELTPEQHNDMTDFLPSGKQLTLTPEPPSMIARQKFSQIAKGFILDGGKVAKRIPTRKPQEIAGLLARWPGEQALIWTVFDEEGEILAENLNQPGRTVAHLTGKTPEIERHRLIKAFRCGGIDVMISKPRLLGFGLNLPFVSVMIFSGLRDSYEEMYQAIKRAHRYGAERQLKVYLPYTPLEEPMLRNVLAKRTTFEADAAFQERLYITNLAQDLKDYVEGVKIDTDTDQARQATIAPTWLRAEDRYAGL